MITTISLWFELEAGGIPDQLCSMCQMHHSVRKPLCKFTSSIQVYLSAVRFVNYYVQKKNVNDAWVNTQITDNPMMNF